MQDTVARRRPAGITWLSVFSSAFFLVTVAGVAYLGVAVDWLCTLLLPLPLFWLWHALALWKGWKSAWQLGHSNPGQRWYYDQDEVRAFFGCENRRAGGG